MKTREAGFTLIEMLVALALFAIVAVVGYQGVGQILRNKTELSDHAAEWRTLQRCFDLFHSDILSMVDRSIRDQFGVKMPGLVGDFDAGRDWDTSVQWTRLKTEGAGSAERVGWRWREDRLERVTWLNLDRGPRDNPVVTPVLTGVTDFQLRYLGPEAGAALDTSWHLPQHDGLPVLIELTLEVNRQRWVRVFRVVTQ
jgi:general secretion pathway protein J